MDKRMSKEEARQILKSAGLKMSDFARYLGIDSKSISGRWRNGLDIQNYLMLAGYLAEHDKLAQQLARHRNNKALLALLDELDSKEEPQADAHD